MANTIIKQIKIGTPISRVSADVPDVTTANITDFNVSGKTGGDLLVYDSSTGKYTTTGITGSNGINVTYLSGDSNVNISLASSGASAGSYGNIARVPVISVNAQGLIDSIGEVAISVVGGSAVTAIDFDSSSGVLTVTTGDGTYTAAITLDPYTTNDLSEGSNLYYTQARADSDARHAIRVIDSGGDGSLSYDPVTGILNFTGPSTNDILSRFSAGSGISLVNGQISIDSTANIIVNGITASKFETTDSGIRVYGNILPGTDSAYSLGDLDNKWKSLYVSGNTIYLGTITLEDENGAFVVRTASGDIAPINFGGGTTTNLAEGNNLYYTQARFDSAFANKTTSDLIEGTNKYYTLARFDSAFNLRFNVKTTTNLPEGVNKYYTDARVRNVVDSNYIQARQITYDLSPYATTTYVDSAVAALVNGAPDALDTLNELAAALGNDSNFASTITTSIATKLPIASFNTYFNSALLGKSTADLSEGTNKYYTDARVRAVIDSDYIQARVAPVDVVDSTAIISIATNLVDSAYIQARQTTYDFLDSAEVISLIDSAYVQARVAPVDVVDSAAILALAGGLVDSAYVQARQTQQDFSYSSLTGTPNVLDSTDVTNIIDSSYVNARLSSDLTLTSITLDSNNPGVTTNKLYSRNGHLYWNGASLDSAGLGYLAVNKAGDTMSGNLSIDKETPQIFFNHRGDAGIEVGMGVYGEDFYIYEPEDPNGTQVPVGMGAGRQWLAILDATQTVNAFGYKVWTAGNDGPGTGLDADLLDGQEGNYYRNFNNLSNVPDFITQDSVVDLVDSAYVQLRQLISGDIIGLDSADVAAIVDSNFVQLRQDYSWTSITGKPNILDSADVQFIIDSDYISARTTVTGVDSQATINLITATVDGPYITDLGIDFGIDSARIIALIDSDYVRIRQTPSGVDSAATIALIDSDYVRARQDPGLDSSLVAGIITSVVDAAYVQNRQETYDFLDSAEAIALIDSAYVRARETYSTANALFAAIKTLDSNVSGLNADTLDGQQGTYYLNYNNFSNLPNVLDSADVAAITNASFDKAYVDSLGVDAATLGGHDSTYYLNYNNFTNTPNVLDSTDVKNIFSAGTGITYNNGEFSIGQSVGISDSVQFGSLTLSGNLVVNGTTTTITQDTLTITSSIIHLADGQESTNNVDIGFIGHYSTNNGVTRQHTGLVRDATNNEYYFFNGLIQDALDSTAPDQVIAVGGTGWQLANLNAGKGTFTGDVSGNNKSSLDVYARTGGAFGARIIRNINQVSSPAALLVAADGDSHGDIIFEVRSKSDASLLDVDNKYNSPDTRFAILGSGATIIAPSSRTLGIDSNGINAIRNGALLSVYGNASVDKLYVTSGTVGGIQFPTDAFGGSGDTAKIYLAQDGVTENQQLTIATTNDAADEIHLRAPSNDGVKINDYIVLHAGNALSIIDSAYVQSLQNLVDSASIIALVDSNYVQLRQDYAYSSLTGAPTAVSSFSNDANYLDSTTVQDVIDEAYINAVTIDADTLGGNDSSYYLNYSNFTNTPNVLDSGHVSSIILADVDNTYVQSRQDYAYSSLTGTPNVLDSVDIMAILDSAVDGTFIGDRIDIDYIASQIDIGGVGFANFTYQATADQTTFSDSDIKGNVLSYVSRKVEVYRNGVLLVDSDQYVSTSGNQIVLTTGADSGDVISISAFTATNGFFNGRDSGDGMVITGNLDVRGTSLLRSSTEEIQLKDGATGVVNHNFQAGSTFYHTNVASDFTVNITNPPTAQNRAFTIAIIIQQTGSGPYIPNALQIAGSAQTIKWAEDTEPLGYLNNLDLVTFTILNISGTYVVMGQMITYG